MFRTLTTLALAAATLSGPRSTTSVLHAFTGPVPEVARLSERTPTAAILKVPLA